MNKTYKIVRFCSTPTECAKGLMNTIIGEDECCVFLPIQNITAFWGKNTPQDLLLISISDGLVMGISEIKAYDETPVSVPKAQVYIELAKCEFPYTSAHVLGDKVLFSC